MASTQRVHDNQEPGEGSAEGGGGADEEEEEGRRQTRDGRGDDHAVRGSLQVGTLVDIGVRRGVSEGVEDGAGRPPCGPWYTLSIKPPFHGRRVKWRPWTIILGGGYGQSMDGVL
jgi:hypothetical protein